MFNVRVDNIRERTTNGPTYMKGRQYYRQGKVRHLSFDQEKGIILAQVEGSRTYSVRIILTGKGELHDATCTCSAFAAYWGLCRHIAATLLYSIDAFGRQKTHIMPADSAKPGISGSADNELSETEPAELDQNEAPAAENLSADPGLINRQQQSARQQAQRRSRSKTRDFLTRIDNATRMAETSSKIPLKLQVTLHCAPASITLPWLSFAVGENQLYPVPNVEQFAEAISRDLPLELDKNFTLSPLQHRFSAVDMPLIKMLQDSFENDYKAVFGTSHSSSRDRYFTLNATRFAAFLLMADGLTDSGWHFIKDNVRQPIKIRQSNLPVSLFLSTEIDPVMTAISSYRLEFHCDQNMQQMTASRNVYLVGDQFYLPSHESIRLIEPILSTFNSPGIRHLLLTREEALYLISEIRPSIETVCPVFLDESLSARIIAQPLQTTVDIDTCKSGLRADVSFCYGSEMINPLLPAAAETDQEINDGPLIIRDRAGEERVQQFLTQAGFSRHNQSFQLNDSDDLYRYLSTAATGLEQIAEVRMSPAAKSLRILKAPIVRFDLNLADSPHSLNMSQHFSDLPESERSAYIQALRDKRSYIRTLGGNFRQINLDNRDLLLQIVDLLQLWGVKPGTEVSQLPRYRALALNRLLQQPDVADLLKVDESVKSMIQHLLCPGELSFKLPSTLHGKLRPYQKTGFHWLCTLDYYGLGGILADDMGLGKTLQTIAFVSMIWQQKKRPSLIIAPTSLVYNWLSEFEKFAPKLPVMILDGSRQQRTSRLCDIDDHACVITSYSLLRRDIDELGACSFASCFLDEAQNIKNPETLNARSVKQVKADRCFALTGTPIENSLTELWSIFDFILPGYLYNQKTFQNVFELPIVRDNSGEALESLHHQILPFVLRRMKKDVLTELPEKIETRTICEMTDEQRKIYESFLSRSRADLDKEVSINGYAHSQIFILALLTRLRQICCHPGLFIRDYEGGSGKLQLLEELLADCFSAGHRVLVFSQFTSMLEMIREDQIRKGCTPFYIDGQVPAEERLTQVQRFNQGEGKLFLISLRAGGTGLNLTGADTVIHFDPWWNPAVEEQATDRAYRIGQENVVQVFKLYTRQSIEEKIQHLQQKKQHLIDAVIKPGQNLLSKMSLEEVRSLFEP